MTRRDARGRFVAAQPECAFTREVFANALRNEVMRVSIDAIKKGEREFARDILLDSIEHQARILGVGEVDLFAAGVR